MNYELCYIVPCTVKGASVRKLVFSPQGVSKDSPDYHHASMLAGPWTKQTLVCKGLIDGAPIAAPYALPLALKVSDHGPVLSLSGARLTIVDPTIVVLPEVGADGKPLRNLRGGVVAIESYTLSTGADEPALAGSADDSAFG